MGAAGGAAEWHGGFLLGVGATSALCSHPADLPFHSDGCWGGEQALGSGSCPLGCLHASCRLSPHHHEHQQAHNDELSTDHPEDVGWAQRSPVNHQWAGPPITGHQTARPACSSPCSPVKLPCVLFLGVFCLLNVCAFALSPALYLVISVGQMLPIFSDKCCFRKAIFSDLPPVWKHLSRLFLQRHYCSSPATVNTCLLVQ